MYSDLIDKSATHTAEPPCRLAARTAYDTTNVSRAVRISLKSSCGAPNWAGTGSMWSDSGTGAEEIVLT